MPRTVLAVLILLTVVCYGTYRTTYERDRLYTYDAPIPWTIAAGGAASDNQIQFNDGGLFTGDADFTYEASGDLLTVDNIDVNDLDVITNLQVGDANNSTWDANGFLTMSGDGRVMKEYEFAASDFSPGASGPTAAPHGNYPSYEFTIGDDMYASFEVPHDWDSSTDLTITVYWAIDEAYSANNGEVQWQALWSATPSDESEDLTSPTHTGTIDFGDQNIPATANHLTEITGTIPAASLSRGDMIGLHGSRVALDGGANPTAEPYIIHLEVVYYSDRLGEAL